jgi:hypothetical protein
MEPIKISVDVTVNLSESVKAFLSALACTTAKSEPTPVVAAKSEPTPAVATKSEPTPAVATKSEPTPAVATKSITIEDVRKVLSEKVNDHRSEIKNKLTELGAPSVTKLDQDKYQEMYNFLISL